MGELLLCNDEIAGLPYYVEGLGLNIYSIEELAYYIENNVYLLDRSFMSEELCTWVEKELKATKLAIRLRDLMHGGGRLSDYVLYILEASGYCSKQELQEILFVIRELEQKSEFECNKIRADRLMENNKFINSIYEYKRLLNMEEAKSENPLLIGNIWHNLGVAYARLFLFEEAARCFKNAYEHNGRKESMRECLFAYRCMRDENGFLEMGQEFGLDSESLQALREEVSAASRNENTQAFEDNLEQIAHLNNSMNREDYRTAITDIILQWKEDYRRDCKS